MRLAGNRIRGREGLARRGAASAAALAALAFVAYEVYEGAQSIRSATAPAQICVIDEEWIGNRTLDVQVFALGLRSNQKLAAVAITWGDGQKSEIDTDGASTIGTGHEYLRWVGGAVVTAHTIVAEQVAGGHEQTVTVPTDASCEYTLPAAPLQNHGG